MPSLSDILNGTLDTISLPGQYTRGALAGRAGEKLGGRDMLESWGALSPNTPGFDMGDVAGFLAEAIVDPVNLIPFGAIGGALGLSRAAKAAKLAKGLVPSGADLGLARSLGLADALGIAGLDLTTAGNIGSGLTRKKEVRGLFQEGVNWMAQDSKRKLRETLEATGDINIINPHSGIKRFKNGGRGMDDIDALERKDYWMVPSKDTAAHYQAQAFYDNTAPAAMFHNEPVDALGRPNIIMTPHGKRPWKVPKRDGRRQFGLGTKEYAAPDSWWRSTGVHEGNHYLTDKNNMSDELAKYLGDQLDASQAEKADFGVGFKVPEGKTAAGELQYYMKKDEIYSRIQEMRKAMEEAGVARPDLPGHLGDLTDTENFITGSEWDDGVGTSAMALRRLFTDKRLASILRNAPVLAGAAATPVAASIYGDQA